MLLTQNVTVENVTQKNDPPWTTFTQLDFKGTPLNISVPKGSDYLVPSSSQLTHTVYVDASSFTYLN